MSTNSKTKVSSLSVELVHTDGEVTLAASNGTVITVQSNDLMAALGTVFAVNMAAFHDYWRNRVACFEIKMEITTH